MLAVSVIATMRTCSLDCVRSNGPLVCEVYLGMIFLCFLGVFALFDRYYYCSCECGDLLDLIVEKLILTSYGICVTCESVVALEQLFQLGGL